MSVYDLKPKFQNMLRPLCGQMARAGVTANHVTLLALLLSFLAGGLVLGFNAAHWTLLLVPVFLFVRMALNAIDGMLAREHDMQTPLGAILNELGDVVSDAAIYLPLALVPGIPKAMLAIVVVLAVVSEMTGVVAVQIGASRRYDGPMGKSDRGGPLWHDTLEPRWSGDPSRLVPAPPDVRCPRDCLIQLSRCPLYHTPNPMITCCTLLSLN